MVWKRVEYSPAESSAGRIYVKNGNGGEKGGNWAVEPSELSRNGRKMICSRERLLMCLIGYDDAED